MSFAESLYTNLSYSPWLLYYLETNELFDDGKRFLCKHFNIDTSQYTFVYMKAMINHGFSYYIQILV